MKLIIMTIALLVLLILFFQPVLAFNSYYPLDGSAGKCRVAFWWRYPPSLSKTHVLGEFHLLCLGRVEESEKVRDE